MGGDFKQRVELKAWNALAVPEAAIWHVAMSESGRRNRRRPRRSKKDG